MQRESSSALSLSFLTVSGPYMCICIDLMHILEQLFDFSEIYLESQEERREERRRGRGEERESMRMRE